MRKSGRKDPPTISVADTRGGRVSGAQVGFGAPGPRVDLSRVLETWRDGVSIEGAASDEVAPPAPRPKTVSLSDGTTISFANASRALAPEE
jgi:hypothetical protein